MVVCQLYVTPMSTRSIENACHWWSAKNNVSLWEPFWGFHTHCVKTSSQLFSPILNLKQCAPLEEINGDSPRTCTELSDCIAVTVAVGVKINCGDRGTARPKLLATCTRLLCCAWKTLLCWAWGGKNHTRNHKHNSQVSINVGGNRMSR